MATNSTVKSMPTSVISYPFLWRDPSNGLVRWRVDRACDVIMNEGTVYAVGCVDHHPEVGDATAWLNRLQPDVCVILNNA